MNISTKANTDIKLKRLVESSILYLIWASIAAVVAIVLNRPAQFGGSTSGLPVVRDFIHGTGTALSPSLVWMLAQALFTWLAWNQPAPSRYPGWNDHHPVGDDGVCYSGVEKKVVRKPSRKKAGLIGDLRGCGVRRRPRSFLTDGCRGSATFGALKAAVMSVDESAEVVADFLDHQAGGDHR
jgi:hypothetical protein